MAPTKTLIERIGQAAGLAPDIGVKSARASLNDEIAKLLLRGLDARAVVSRLGPVKVRDGYNERPLDEADVAFVATFIRQARSRLNGLHRQTRDSAIEAAQLQELLK